MAVSNNTIYQNEVLENKYSSILATKLDLQRFMTVDNSLAMNAGMIKKVITKTATGDVDDLQMGEGNTKEISVSTSTVPYTVGTTQGKFVYFDEEAMADPAVVEAGLTGLAESMVNSFVAKAVGEWEQAEEVTCAAFDFAGVVDAIASMNLEDESGLFLLINPEQVAEFRKGLGEELKYSEGFARTGYIGSVCGVPVYISKAIVNPILASKEAVTLFIKKDSEIEQERDADIRQNRVFARKVALVALTDATKCRKLVKA